ncbi:hypothetical protein PSYJA_39600, partial [Pseudomonas syringae pv. japonica str. M301072]
MNVCRIALNIGLCWLSPGHGMRKNLHIYVLHAAFSRLSVVPVEPHSHPVTVEAHLANCLPALTRVGLPEGVIKERKD